ncbi:hypothetical protein JCM5350_000977 [Sporobolomyces pararoseus]
MYTPPPPAYRSTASTPTLSPNVASPGSRQQQRLSASTITTTNTNGSGSSSRYSFQSFDFSVRSTCPSIFTNASSPQSTKDKDKERFVGTIQENDREGEDDGEEKREQGEEDDDDSPVDPLQARPPLTSSYSVQRTPQPYLYFSPLDYISPPLLSTSARPIPPSRTVSSTSVSPASLYPYPIDYGESIWSYKKEVPNGGGTVTPRSFRTVATDGSEEGAEGRNRALCSANDVEENQPRKSRSTRAQPSRIQTTESTAIPLKSCLKMTKPGSPTSFPSPVNATSPLLSQTPFDEPFLPTSPLLPSKPSPSPASVRPQNSSKNSFLSTTSSTSSLTVTPQALSLTPTPSRMSHISRRSSIPSTAPPQRIWSARTNRYIYINTTTTAPSLALRHSRSFPNSTSKVNLSLSNTREERQEEGTVVRGGKQLEMVQIPNLPYVTRSPTERGRTVVASGLVGGGFDIEMETRGRSRSRNPR